MRGDFRAMMNMICGWLIALAAAAFSAFVFHAPLRIVYFMTHIDQCFKWLIAFLGLRGDKWIHNDQRGENRMNPVILYADGLPVELKSFHDLSFLGGYGRVFRVFDQMISGTLAFGIQNDKGRYFLKYAGAPVVNYLGNPDDAIDRLKNAAYLYETLSHPLLPNLADKAETEHGFLLVFPWIDGYPLGPLTDNYQQMRKLPVSDRLRMLDSFFSFHVLVSLNDYIAAGLTDNHLTIDYGDNTLYLNSIDDYAKMPVMNVRGRLPGSPWYLAPECYHTAASLDERVTIYAMGAAALTFLGNRQNPALSSWESSPALFHITMKALAEDPQRRFPSTEAFLTAWRQGIFDTPFI